jgi:hypothetical protein
MWKAWRGDRVSLVVRVLLAVWASLTVMARPASAGDSPVGTWAKKAETGKPVMVLVIETWESNKAKLTYRIKEPAMVMTIVSALDGSDAPVLINGKPSGETMAIKRLDKRHSTTVVKMNGKPFGTSRGTFSEDFNTLTVENDFAETADGNAGGKSTEVWTRQ